MGVLTEMMTSDTPQNHVFPREYLILRGVTLTDYHLLVRTP